MTAVVRIRVIFVCLACVQNLRVGEELDIASLEIHLKMKRWVVGDCFDEFHRVALFSSESAAAELAILLSPPNFAAYIAC